MPLIKEKTGSRMIYRITMGVRPSDQEWKRTLNKVIKDNQAEINKHPARLRRAADRRTRQADHAIAAGKRERGKMWSGDEGKEEDFAAVGGLSGIGGAGFGRRRRRAGRFPHGRLPFAGAGHAARRHGGDHRGGRRALAGRQGSVLRRHAVHAEAGQPAGGNHLERPGPARTFPAASGSPMSATARFRKKRQPISVRSCRRHQARTNRARSCFTA